MMNSEQRTMGRTVGTGRRALSEEVAVGFKRSEVGVIPEDWQCLRFGDAVNLLTGFPFSSSGYVDSGVLLVRGSNIKRGTLDWGAEITQYWPKITSEVAKYELRKGDLVIAMDGALVGRSYAVISNADLPSLLLQRVARIRSSQLHQDLLTFLVANDSFVNHADSTKTHTAIPHISSEDIRSFLIAVPPESEQRAIAEALSDVDGLLAAMEALIAKKRAVKQAVMQQLLTGKTRLPGFRGKWETMRLGEIGPFSKGRGIKREDVIFEGLPCVRYGELYTRYHNYILRAESRIPLSVALTALPIQTGDLLFAGSGETAEEIGRCAAYLGKEQAYAGGDIIVLTPSNQSSVYFGHLMNHPTVAVQKARMGQGNAVVHISASNLAQVEIVIPSLKEQSAIAAVLSDMDAEIASLNRRRDKTRAVKQGMMQQLLTGRIRLVKPELAAEKSAAATPVRKKHNWQFNEAVVISMLAKHFGNEQYPLGRMRYTKLSYLLHRREEGHAEGYLKKAAGPYNPQTKYGGPEKIALQKDYLHQCRSGKRQGFIAGTNFEQAKRYFDKWYGSEVLKWLEQFRYKTNNDLELLTTVDMAVGELCEAGEKVSVESVKEVIRSHPEWNPKLDRPIFSDAKLARAIESCQKFFDRSSRQETG